jgi:hypothetical protein
MGSRGAESKADDLTQGTRKEGSVRSDLRAARGFSGARPSGPQRVLSPDGSVRAGTMATLRPGVPRAVGCGFAPRCPLRKPPRPLRQRMGLGISLVRVSSRLACVGRLSRLSPNFALTGSAVDDPWNWLMKEYQAGDIRNFAIVGHASSGKTMLSEPCWPVPASSTGWAASLAARRFPITTTARSSADFRVRLAHAPRMAREEIQPPRLSQLWISSAKGWVRCGWGISR